MLSSSGQKCSYRLVCSKMLVDTTYVCLEAGYFVMLKDVTRPRRFVGGPAWPRVEVKVQVELGAETNEGESWSWS